MDNKYTPLTAHFEFLVKQNKELKKNFDWILKQSDIVYDTLDFKQNKTWQKKIYQIVKKVKQLKKEENCFCPRIQTLKTYRK